MTKEEFIELKDSYIEHIQQYFKKSGDIFAHVAVFAEFKKDTNPSFNEVENFQIVGEEETDVDKPAIIHIPIPNEFLETGLGKDIFKDHILPDAINDIKTKCNIIGIAWTAEAWMSVTNKMPKNLDELPVKAEVIIISVESEHINECKIFEIKRTEMSVLPDGKFQSEKIEFENINTLDAKSTGGRFSGLFKLIKD